MSGVKAGLSGIAQNAGTAGKPAANAGQSGPSIDDILASIRQIISDQNRDADQAAEKAAANVANKSAAPTNVQSMIGTVAAGHWSGNTESQPPATTVAPTIVASVDHNSQTSDKPSYPDELDDLIQLIGSSPPAPRVPKQANWIDPQSINPTRAVSNPAAVVANPAPKTVDPMVNPAKATPAAEKAKVILPVSGKPVAQQQNAKPAQQLQSSVSPKTDVPQTIEKAIVRPVATTTKPASDSAQKPVVGQKSALDRLISKKEGAPQQINAAPVQPVQQPHAKQSTAPSQQRPIVAAATPAKPQENGSAPQTVANSVTPAAIATNSVNAVVVKSIERLATSMFADRKEEIDGMMAGIVRPMLQDWLEDNLPSLVERIVREEIERVSRGTHR